MVDKNLFKKLNSMGGRLFELLSIHCLEEMVGKNRVIDQPPRPDFMLIDPDIGIKRSKSKMDFILVSHATAKNAATMKIDRSIEELFQIKTGFPKGYVPKVINLIWHSPYGWTSGQISRLSSAFDLNWVAFDDINFFERNIKDMIVMSEKIKILSDSEIEEYVRNHRLTKLFNKKLIPHLSKVFSARNRKHSKFWLEERKRLNRIKKPPPESINNNLKQDLMVLAFTPIGEIMDFINGKREKPCTKYDSGVASGALLEQKSISGKHIVMNPEMRYRMRKIMNLIDESVLQKTIQRVKNSEGFNLLQMAYDKDSIVFKRIKHIKRSIDQNKFLLLIQQSWNADDSLYTGSCWPIEYGVTIIQECIDPSYGFMTLQRDSIGDQNLAYGWNPLGEYVSGKKDSLSKDQLSSIGDGLSLKLKLSFSEHSLQAIIGKVKSGLRIKARRKKKSNPLKWFVLSVLERENIYWKGFPDQPITRKCLFSELAGLSAVTGRTVWQFSLPSKSDNSEQLLHILSSYSSTHKHKEFSLKSRLAFYKVKNDQIIRDRSISDVTILLDGIWSQSEVNMLSNAGINIFGIDQVNDWVCSIKK